jgi:sulfur-oxidizing protein SoxY
MAEYKPESAQVSRRKVLAGAAAVTALSLTPGAAWATPKEAKKKLSELLGGVKPKKGRVNISLPPLTEQGPLVPITVTVDSPMTAQDHVKSIHIVAQRNTIPEVASYHLCPECGKAEISTRIRVAKSQVIVVGALMSDGSAYMGLARCKVAAGAGGCG